LATGRIVSTTSIPGDLLSAFCFDKEKIIYGINYDEKIDVQLASNKGLNYVMFNSFFFGFLVQFIYCTWFVNWHIYSHFFPVPWVRRLGVCGSFEPKKKKEGRG